MDLLSWSVVVWKVIAAPELKVCSLTQRRAHCVVRGGSKVFRRVSPSHPLSLARAGVLPAAHPVFKWATHKFQSGFIGYKRGAELKTQFWKQKSKVTAAPGQTPGVTAMSSTATKPRLWVSASMSTWTLKKKGRMTDEVLFISIAEAHSSYLKRSGGVYRLREPDPVASTASTAKHKLAVRWSRTKIHPQHARVAVKEPRNVHQPTCFLLTATFWIMGGCLSPSDVSAGRTFTHKLRRGGN